MVKRRKEERPGNTGNTILLDALQKHGLDLSNGALFFGVKEGTLKRWVDFKGLAPKKISPELAVRLKVLTGLPPEHALPQELFELSKKRLSKREIKALDPNIVRTLIGASYLMQDPALAVERREQEAKLLDAIRDLPLEQIQVIQLKYFVGKSDLEIAKDLDISESRVRILDSRGMDALRAIVHGYPKRLH